jgi:hypothetical protein
MNWQGMWHAWQRRESLQGFAGKRRGKETSRKTEAWMEEWDQNKSYGDWLGG